MCSPTSSSTPAPSKGRSPPDQGRDPRPPDRQDLRHEGDHRASLNEERPDRHRGRRPGRRRPLPRAAPRGPSAAPPASASTRSRTSTPPATPARSSPNDGALGGEAALLRNHGLKSRNEVAFWGYNSRLDNLQAAVLNRRLPGLPKVTAARRRNAELYRKGLAGVVLEVPRDAAGRRGRLSPFRHPMRPPRRAAALPESRRASPRPSIIRPRSTSGSGARWATRRGLPEARAAVGAHPLPAHPPAPDPRAARAMSSPRSGGSTGGEPKDRPRLRQHGHPLRRGVPPPGRPARLVARASRVDEGHSEKRLLEADGNDLRWQALQAEAYGRGILGASFFPGCRGFPAAAPPPPATRSSSSATSRRPRISTGR